MVLLLERKVGWCWVGWGSSVSLSSELSWSTDAFEWLYFLLVLSILANNCCLPAFFETVPVCDWPFPFCPWLGHIGGLSIFSTCPVDMRDRVIGGWLMFGLVDGMLMFLTDSRIIWRIVFKNAFLKSAVLEETRKKNILKVERFENRFQYKKSKISEWNFFFLKCQCRYKLCKLKFRFRI